MKRSETVEEIRKILAMNGKDNGCGELEEAILHHLEVIGMLPPGRQEEVVIGYADEEGNQMTQVIYLNEWEPEDEEE